MSTVDDDDDWGHGAHQSCTDCNRQLGPQQQGLFVRSKPHRKDVAITSRENSDTSIPARPWVTPPHIAGTPPATCAQSLAAFGDTGGDAFDGGMQGGATDI